jgi:hypothetical protein
MVPFPDPDGVTVHHDWSLEAVQEEVEVTVNEVLPAGGVTGWLEGVTVRTGVRPACMTVTMIGVSPVTVIVMFATREVSKVFAV